MSQEFNPVEAAKKLAERDSYDRARTIVLTLVNAVPYVGGSIAQGLSEYLPDWQVERIREFLRGLASDFERVKDRVDQQAATSEEYLLMFRRVMREASETTGGEKFKAYRAVLVNACTPRRPDKAEQDLFLKRLGDLEEIHVVILAILASVPPDPGATTVQWLQRQPHDLIETAYADLSRMDLVRDSSNIAGHLTIPDDFRLLHNLLTPLGDRFVRFVQCLE